MNKNVSVWRGDQTPPTDYHLWIKSDNNVYLHNGVDWVRSNQSYQIVNSIEELDENAKQGSLGVVANNKIQERRTLRDSYYKNESLIYIEKIQITIPTSPLLSNTDESPLVIASKGFDNLPECLDSGKPFVGLVYSDRSVIGLTEEEHEFPIMSEGMINESALKDFNRHLSTVTDAVFYGAISWVDDTAIWVEPTEDQWSDLEVLFRCDATEEINSTQLYIKETDGWKLFKTGSDVVNNLEDGGKDKALSAEMGKELALEIEYVYNELDSQNILYSSIEELPLDSPVGTLAKVIVNNGTKVQVNPISAYNDGDILQNIILNTPESIDVEAIGTIVGTVFSIRIRFNKGSNPAYLSICYSKMGYAGSNIGGSFAMYFTVGNVYPSDSNIFLNYDSSGTLIQYSDAVFNSLNNYLKGSRMQWLWVRPTTPSASILSVIDGFLQGSITEVVQTPAQYIKVVGNKWKQISGEIANDLEGGENKVLSAEMGKFLNEKITNIISGTTTDPIKFKGYVNVDSKDGINGMFGLLSEGEACLVAPSVNNGSGDSYKAWIASAINQEDIPISEELFKTEHNISLESIATGNLEVKTYLKLDEGQPYCKCPDMILLCKVKVRAKDFIEFVDDVSSSIASLIPNSLMLTACIGKVLRWSGCDWVVENQALLERGIVKNYSYRHSIDSAIQTGVISYTDIQGTGNSAIGVGGWFTVFVNASADVDSGGVYVVSQTAYGRSGESANRVFTRLLFVNSNNIVSNRTPWVETTKNTNILPNVNGWLLNPDEQLTTGVYQTCDAALVVDADGKRLLRNNYFTMFVNASTTPNGDGWDAIEQTAYGREADDGKIYRRVIFYNKGENVKQIKGWLRIDNEVSSAVLLECLGVIEENFTTKDDLSQAIDNAITKTLNTAV